MASTDPEIVAQEEVYPKHAGGYKFPGVWHNERYHQQLLREARDIIAKREAEEELAVARAELEEQKETPAPKRRPAPQKKEKAEE